MTDIKIMNVEYNYVINDQAYDVCNNTIYLNPAFDEYESLEMYKKESSINDKEYSGLEKKLKKLLDNNLEDIYEGVLD